MQSTRTAPITGNKMATYPHFGATGEV
jgi:hypothetical protein